METRYKEPSEEQIKRAFADLDIPELKNLVSKVSDPKILLGGAVFFLKKIELSYRLRSPTQDPNYNVLREKILGITPENPMHEKEQLVYLHHYHEYQKSQDAKKVPELDKDIQPVTDSILSRTPDLKTALTKRPCLQSLEHKVTQLPQIYEQQCQARLSSYLWTNDINHQKAMLVIKFLSTYEADKILSKLSHSKDKAELEFKQYQYTVYTGALLAPAMKIERDYEMTPLDTARSDLFKLCSRALNLNQTNELPALTQLNCLFDYRRFLREVIADKEALAVLKNFRVKDADVLSKIYHLDRRRIDRFEDAQDYLINLVKSLDELIESPAFIWKCARQAVDYAVLGVAGVACLELSLAGYSMGFGRGVIVKLAGKLGELFIKGPWGAFVGGTIGAKYEKGAIVGGSTAALSFAFTYLWTWATGKNLSKLDSCNTADEFRAELKDEIGLQRDGEKEAQNMVRQMEWYRAVTQLPSSTLTTEVRERVSYAVLGPPDAKEHAKDNRGMGLN